MKDQSTEPSPLTQPFLKPTNTSKKQSTRFKGVMLSLFSSVFLHGQKMFSKLAMENSTVTPFQIMYFRSAVIFFIFLSCPLCKRKLSYIDQPAHVLRIVILRGFINVWAGLTLYLAISLIPYSETILLNELKPIFGSLLAFFILHQRILPVEIAALIISLFAVYIYADPGGYLNGGIPRAQDFKDGVTPGNPIGLFFGVLKGFLGGLGSVFLRKIGKTKADFQLPLFYMGLFGTLIMPFIIIPSEISNNSEEDIPPLAIFYLLMVGCSITLGQILLYEAYKYEKASTVLVIGYTEIIYAIFTDLVIFDSHLRWTDYLATALIFLGTFLIFLNKCKKS